VYEELCPYVHSQADATNGAIWESNGPIYVADAFAAFGEAYKDTLGMCYLLLTIGWQGFRIPDEAWSLFDRADGPRNNVHVGTLREFYS
jgi:hypothetical protein